MNVFKFNKYFTLSHLTLRHLTNYTAGCVVNYCSSHVNSLAPQIQKLSSCSQKLACVATYRRQFLTPVIISVNQNRHFNRKKTKKIPPTKPLSFDYSGDIEKNLPEVDLSTSRLDFQDSTLLAECDEEVKKILSLEFGDRQALRDEILDKVIKNVQEHPTDVVSLEYEIARKTIAIRNQVKHALRYRKDKVSKTLLINRITSRKYDLIRLRDLDREKFDWLLKELKIKYKQPLEDNVGNFRMKYIPPTKAEIREKKAIASMDATKNERLEALRKQFEQERADFERTKHQELAAFEKELKEMGINTQVDSMEVLFKEMGLGPPYVVEKKFVPRRSQILQMKFKKYMIEKNKNATPT